MNTVKFFSFLIAVWGIACLKILAVEAYIFVNKKIETRNKMAESKASEVKIDGEKKSFLPNKTKNWFVRHRYRAVTAAAVLIILIMILIKITIN